MESLELQHDKPLHEVKDRGAQPAPGKLYLIPTELVEGETAPIPAYVREAVQDCQAFFVENERSARRYLKRLWREMVIDACEWVTIHKAEDTVVHQFEQALLQGKHIGILSEAGCPGVADPGQILVAKAQALGVTVLPLVGPSSILLGLMGSGLNGQSFRFNGYLPIEASARRRTLHRLEDEVYRLGTTQIFIETPYRNEAILKALLEDLQGETLLCIAADLTSKESEYIRTLPVKQWKNEPLPTLHKRPAIFLIGKAN